ncbi:type II toxin-antitoxin system HipA family toxin [Microvirga ossetica]|nr:HipA domain-containing protein [Microvirga ossetica]
MTFEGGEFLRPGAFQYDQSYLETPGATPLDPLGLPIVSQVFQGVPEAPLALLDTGPEGWGRSVLAMAFEGSVLGAAEFLAAGTTNRTGDLAFGASAEAGPGHWRPDGSQSLGRSNQCDDLEAFMLAAIAADESDATADQIAMLVRACADIGGARPKVRWRDREGGWIAKFPTWGDKFDDPRIEAVCLDVAEAARLPIPERRLMTFSGKTVLLVRRFDRSEDGKPYAYLSMGTLLNEPASSYGTTRTYRDMAAASRAIGVEAPEEQMYRRLLVNASLHNTDDHLRNHAVINTGEGWELSPVFDVVPNLGRKRHVCAPAPGFGDECNPRTAFASYTAFGLPLERAEAMLDDVMSAMGQLPEFFDRREVSQADRVLLRGLKGQ